MIIPDFKKRVLLRDFYQEANLILPENSKHRTFKFKTWEKNDKGEWKWFTVYRKIRTVEQLRKYLVELAPQDCYFSVSQFLNNKQARVKKYTKRYAGFEQAYNILLGSDYIIDIDEEEGQRQKAFDEMKRIADYVRNTFGFTDMTFTNTNRGQQILINNFYEKYIGRLTLEDYEDYKSGKNVKCLFNCKDREHHLSNILRGFTWKLKDAGCKFDFSVAMDTRRIVRLFNSVHHSGVICNSTNNFSEIEKLKEVKRLW